MPERHKAEPHKAESRTALIAGATGLIGSSLLGRLLDDALYTRVTAVVRRSPNIDHAKLTAPVVDFDRLEQHGDLLQADDVFCCLGTTIRKAGSKDAFRRVDQHYVEAVALHSRGVGAQRFILVSSVGADATSGNFYSSVKGAAEDAVAAVGFDTIHVFRPSLLMGERQEIRHGERLAMAVLPWITPLLAGRFRCYRPIAAATVAAAMLRAAKGSTAGHQVYMYDDIVRLAKDV